MGDLVIYAVLGFFGGAVYGSFFEWGWHRFVMHRPVGRFDYPFRSHALTHHRIFKADHTYHLMDPVDAGTVPMAWWNGPALILVCELPFLALSWLTGAWALAGGAFICFCLYYAAYEYLHWCMHVPHKRRVERSGLFFRLNGHHLLHHRYMNKNFNVVLPLADWLLGTLLTRSNVHFAQPHGPSVPDVQPLAADIGSQTTDIHART